MRALCWAWVRCHSDSAPPYSDSVTLTYIILVLYGVGIVTCGVRSNEDAAMALLREPLENAAAEHSAVITGCMTGYVFYFFFL